MSNNYFSPTQKISGGALFATSNSKEGNIYFRLLKQIANNPDKKGNFDGKNPLNVKLSQDEAADIVRAVRTNGESKFYHKFDANVCSGSFKHYFIKATEEGKADRQGFGLSVKKTVDNQVQEIKVGFTPASAERLSLFLQNALARIFDAEHAEDIKKAKEYSDKKKAGNGENKEKVEETPAETTPIGQNSDGWE